MLKDSKDSKDLKDPKDLPLITLQPYNLKT